MADDALKDILARLERERREADERYNNALTRLDQAIGKTPGLPAAPPAHDDSQLHVVNAAWNILPSGPPDMGGSSVSVKARLRAFVWRLVGPPIEQQQRFNAAVVDHLNRSAEAARETPRAVATMLDAMRAQFAALAEFQTQLILYLQTITWYVDSRDREVGGHALVLNAGLAAVTDGWMKRWESLAAREARYVSRHSSLAAAYNETRELAALAQQSALTLKREVERLIERGLAAPAPGGDGIRPDLESFKYVGFEDRFRGSREDITARLADYLPHFAGASDVLELGCGRGEFLELLRSHGVTARGLDLNHEMVEICRAKGFEVAEADALGHLQTLPDTSLGGLFAAQVIEHLDPTYLLRLVETAFHKLRPGATMILETINPGCWVAFFESYLRDFTHVRPVHPDTLAYLMRAHGFHHVAIEFRSPVAAIDRLQLVPPPAADASPEILAITDALNENAARLNNRLFGFQDYAAVGRR